MTPEPITTPRLELTVATPELLRADASDRPLLARMLGAEIPAGWPQPLWNGALRVLDQWLNARDAAAGWGPWYCVLREPRILVGTGGFKGRPDDSGRIEVGYGIIDEFQRCGLAPEAVEGLIAWAFASGASSVIAHTFERHRPSIRVLEKCGFLLVGPGFEPVDESERGDLGELLLFERRR